MSWIKRMGGRLPDFAEVVRRFPVAVTVMAVFALWIIADNHFNLTSSRDDIFVYSGLILAGYVAVTVKLCAESRKGTDSIAIIIGLALAAIAFCLCYFSKALNFNFVMAIGAVILGLGNAAAWRMGRQDRNVWNFTQKLWTGALFAAVGCVIFTLGMVVISEAVRALFGVNLDKLTVETILPVGLAFLAPVYWLGTLPRFGEAEDVTELSFEARALSFLGTWMLAPLVIIYALIVLAYGAKVLVQWDLPKGEIATLVSPFIGVGMLVWLMLEPKVLKESGFVRFYRAAWHWIMLPAAVLLGVGVFARVHDYGFTPIRVFLVLVVIWAAVQSLWFILMPKVKRDIRIPTVLAAGLLIFGAFGAGFISSESQLRRGKIAKAKFESLTPEDIKDNNDVAQRYRGSIEYFITTEDKRRFNALVPDQKMPGWVRGNNAENLFTSLGLGEIVNGEVINRKKMDIPKVTSLDIEAASRMYFTSRIYLNPESRFDSKFENVSRGRGFEVTYTLGNEVVTVDFKTIVGTPSEVEGLGDRMPISVISQNGINVEFYLLGGELEFENEDLTRAVVSPVFIVPN